MAEEDRTRSSILETLRLLASPADQLAYQENVPFVFVPTELICSWFDDHYVEPSVVQARRQQVASVDRQRFEQLFSPEELRAMDDFSRVFDAVVKELRRPLPAIRELNDLPEWKSVVAAAQNALRRFDDKTKPV